MRWGWLKRVGCHLRINQFYDVHLPLECMKVHVNMNMLCSGLHNYGKNDGRERRFLAVPSIIEIGEDRNPEFQILALGVV